MNLFMSIESSLGKTQFEQELEPKPEILEQLKLPIDLGEQIQNQEILTTQEKNITFNQGHIPDAEKAFGGLQCSYSKEFLKISFDEIDKTIEELKKDCKTNNFDIEKLEGIYSILERQIRNDIESRNLVKKTPKEMLERCGYLDKYKETCMNIENIYPLLEKMNPIIKEYLDEQIRLESIKKITIKMNGFEENDEVANKDKEGKELSKLEEIDLRALNKMIEIVNDYIERNDIKKPEKETIEEYTKSISESLTKANEKCINCVAYIDSFEDVKKIFDEIVEIKKSGKTEEEREECILKGYFELNPGHLEMMKKIFGKEFFLNKNGILSFLEKDPNKTNEILSVLDQQIRNDLMFKDRNTNIVLIYDLIKAIIEKPYGDSYKLYFKNLNNILNKFLLIEKCIIESYKNVTYLL